MRGEEDSCGQRGELDEIALLLGLKLLYLSGGDSVRLGPGCVSNGVGLLRGVLVTWPCRSVFRDWRGRTCGRAEHSKKCNVNSTNFCQIDQKND